MSRGRALIGTSGWSYKSWHGDFYPEGTSRKEELGYLASRVTSSEINASFYRLQKPESYQRWYDETPSDHVFAVKGSRFLTHLKQLRDPEPGLAKLLDSGIAALGDKLGVMLWQLPRTLSFDEPRVERFLKALPATTRHALEPRHPSWGAVRATDLLAAYGVATVYSDSPGAWPALDRDTADFRYVRLHGHCELYTSRYGDGLLDRWAERCDTWMRAGQDVHVYFDNDAHGHAPHDAVRLLQRLGVEPAERAHQDAGSGRRSA
ncbi:MAG: DUF72 domain-containing protein [Marmoricola sp.]